MADRIFMNRTFVSFALVSCLAVFGLGVSARADSPSTMRAARLTFMQGTVTVTEASNTAGVPAQLNLPLLSGVQLSTGSDGQAEVEFEDGSVVRLTPNSALSLDVLTVDPSGVFTTNLSLLNGLAYLELRATPQYRYTVYAGGDVLSPVENATVRVNFDEPPAIFAVLDGTAQVERQSAPNGEATTAGYQTEVRAGESLRADPADANRYYLSPQIDGDSWDQWNEDMDQAAATEATDSTAVRNDYAGAQGYGWSDLDANGSWYNVPGTGPVWQPQVAMDDSGFDPYGNGAWVAYPGTGYLWASSYSWGWTPYRCGSWSYFGGFGWGWAPGASCGGHGWGFAGGGLLVNIGRGPTGYHPVRVPVAHPGGGGGWRPVVPVHTGNGGQRPPGTAPVRSGMRTIAGVSVAPIKPIGGRAIPTDGVAGASLRRDFPVDAQTRTPVLGLASTRPAIVRGPGGAYPVGQRPGSVQVQTVPPQSRPATYPTNGGQAYPAGGQSRQGPGNRAQQPSAQGQRPVQQNAPVQRNAQQPLAPTIYPTPTPAPSQPTYSAPAAPQPEHRSYSPPPSSAPSRPANPAPPAVQPEHRSYSPPPSSEPSRPANSAPPAPQPEHRSAPEPSRPSASSPPPASPPPSSSAPARGNDRPK
jgi:hypothetical protein